MVGRYRERPKPDKLAAFPLLSIRLASTDSHYQPCLKRTKGRVSQRVSLVLSTSARFQVLMSYSFSCPTEPTAAWTRLIGSEPTVLPVHCCGDTLASAQKIGL
jgi:hypothetical protein